MCLEEAARENVAPWTMETGRAHQARISSISRIGGDRLLEDVDRFRYALAGRTELLIDPKRLRSCETLRRLPGVSITLS